MKLKFRKYDYVLLILILLEIGLCIYIGFSQSNSYFCGTGSDCESVQNSIYGSIFGIKLAWFGAACFFALLLLFILAKFDRKNYFLFFSATLIGAGFALYFIYLQYFILGKLCRDCIIIDSIMIIMFSIVVFEYLDFKREVINIEKKAEKALGKAL